MEDAAWSITNYAMAVCLEIRGRNGVRHMFATQGDHRAIGLPM